MRVTAVFNKILNLVGVCVSKVVFEPEEGRWVVTVRLRRHKLVCAHCEFSTWSGYDTRQVDSTWRALDLGRWKVTVRARLRRLACPTHGVVTEGVPFARCGSRFVADFEDLVAWLATRMDKTFVTRLCRIDWRTVGAIITRVSAEKSDPGRLDGLYDISLDEVSYRKGHKYLTVVTDHAKGKVVWTGKGRDADTPGAFFDELGPERSGKLAAGSMDMGPAYAKAVREHAPEVRIVGIRSTWSRWRTPRWTRCAARTGTRCARRPAPKQPASSKGRGGRCANAPRTCPNGRQPRWPRSSAPAGRCGGRIS
jgi:transposase